MRRRCGQSGMSLMELLVAMAIILILISTLIGVGGYVKTRSQLDLTKGVLSVLCAALEQYHSDFGEFPFVTVKDFDGDGNMDPYDQPHLEFDLQGAITSGVLPEHDSSDPLIKISSASSAALFYFLDKNPSSRAIVKDLAGSLITNKDDSGMDITIAIGADTIDLPRYIDPWGMSLRYAYLDGTAFPVLTSAGPDKIFDTPDDVTSQ